MGIQIQPSSFENSPPTTLTLIEADCQHGIHRDV